MSRSWQALPDTRGHRLILLAAAVDAFGIGVFYPLSFLYLLQHTALTSASVGLALSLGTMLALPFGPLLGGPVDRFGPIRPLALSNLIAATGYVLFLSAHSFPLIVGTGFLVMLADRLYWASWPVYVAGVARGSELDDWYALVSVLKNGVVGLGALVSSVALAISARSGEALLLIDAATSVVAAALVMSQHRVARSPPALPAPLLPAPLLPAGSCRARRAGECCGTGASSCSAWRSPRSRSAGRSPPSSCPRSWSRPRACRTGCSAPPSAPTASWCSPARARSPGPCPECGAPGSWWSGRACSPSR